MQSIQKHLLSASLTVIWSDAETWQKTKEDQYLKLNHLIYVLVNYHASGDVPFEEIGATSQVLKVDFDKIEPDNSLENSNGDNILATKVSENLAMVIKFASKLSGARPTHPTPGSTSFEDISILDVIKGVYWLKDKRFKRNLIQLLFNGPDTQMRKLFRSKFDDMRLEIINNLDVENNDAEQFTFYFTCSQWINLEAYCQMFNILPETLEKIARLWSDAELIQKMEQGNSPAEQAGFFRLFNLKNKRIQHLLLP